MTLQIEFLITQGFVVLPCCPPNHHEIDLASHAKKPCSEKASGKTPYDLRRRCHFFGWREAPSLTLEEFRRLLKIKPMPNVGLRLGAGLVRLDIDSELGEHHIAEKKLPLPDSWEFTSGRGRGILYRTPPGKTCYRNIPYEDVELLGEGQQTVIPPSIHRRGTAYAWKAGHAPMDIPLADAPDWIVGLMNEIGTQTLSKTVGGNDASHFWGLTIEEVLGPHQGNFPSPFHDSEGGVNSSISEGVHHCWRHDVCHSPLQALAVLSGIMGSDGNEACFRAGKEHERPGRVPKNSEVEFNRENIEKMWQYAKDQGILAADDLHPFKKTVLTGYRDAEAYFERTEHENKPASFKFVPGELARDILNNEYFLIRSDEGERGELWHMEGGVYRSHGEVFVRRKIEEVLGSWARTITKNQRNEVVDSVRNASYVSTADIPDDPNLLPLLNGVLDLRTKELRSYDPERDFFFQQIPISFDPHAGCPKISQWLNEVVASDTQQALVDYLAGCLWRRPLVEGHFEGIGPPKAAKTFWAAFCRRFLGEENVASISLHTLMTDRFAASGLKFKLANIYADLGTRKIRDVAHFNAVTGGDKVYMQKKYADPTYELPYAKHFFLTNRPARLDADMSIAAWDIQAFFRRLHVVSFPYVFTEGPVQGTNQRLKKERDVLFDELTTPAELSGFLNVVIERVFCVVKHGPSVPRDPEESALEYFRGSNSFQAFVMECCDFKKDIEISREAVKQCYEAYCTDEELAKVSDKEIHNVLVESGVGEYQDPKTASPRKRWWTGFCIKKELLEGDKVRFSTDVITVIKNGTRGVDHRVITGISQQKVDEPVDATTATTAFPLLVRSIEGGEDIERNIKNPVIPVVDVAGSEGNSQNLPVVVPMVGVIGEQSNQSEQVTDVTDVPPDDGDKSNEIVDREERHLKRVLGSAWPFVSGLIDDCAEAIRLDKVKNWGAFQIRAYAERYKPTPSEIIVEILANDVEGYQKTLKLIAGARIIRAGKEAPR